MNRQIGESIAKNTTVMMAAQVVTWASSFILLMFLPRYLGSVDYGRLYLAMSLGMIIGIIIDFGGNYLIPKEVARSKEKTPHILVSYAGARTILWIICMGGLLLFSYIVEYSRVITLLIIILGVSKLWEGGSKAIRSCFQGYEKMEYPSVGVVAEKVFVATLAVAALLLGAGSVEVAIIMTIGAFINLVICIKFVPLIVNRIPPFSFDTSYHLLKYSLPYFMWSIFAVIYYRIDAVMLSTMPSEEVVGWYGGAYRFFDIVMFLPAIFTTVVFPIFSKLWGDKGNNLVNTFQQSLKFILLAAIPICVLFFYYSENLVSLFYGLEEYEPSIIVLQIFSIGIILIYVDFILGSAILATDRQRLWAFVGLVAILINIGLNFLLIPYTQESMGNGGVGAAITTLFTELFIMIAAFIMLPNSYFKNFKLSIPLKCIGSGVIMFATIWYLNSLGIFWMLQATAGFGVYALMVISLRVINKNELQFMREFFTWQNINSIISIKKKEQ
jgi:O-antigen/teichoic acid export membrane protein